MKIVILHPDLGIGGAERLVVDAALAFKSKGHDVQFVTNHHDPKRCFPETSDGSFKIYQVANNVPRHVFGLFHAVLAYFKFILASIWLIFMSDLTPDLIFCDQISISIPILKISSAKILFYCHFPDQLLSKKDNFLKKVYRFPIDKLEEITTGMADQIFVNSLFTASIFRDTFKSLYDIPIEVLYPSLCVDKLQEALTDSSENINDSMKTIFLSLNRFERKKNIKLAIDAFNELFIKLTEKEKLNVYLFVAGGYDERLEENVNYLKELKELAKQYELGNHISFFQSPSDNKKFQLLQMSTAVIYTPSNEHFGIVPLEAMYMKCPVIAVNSGGPRETVIDGSTGFLCKPTIGSFSEAMHKVVRDQTLIKSMGIKGHERVKDHFSFDAFVENINDFAKKVNRKSIFKYSLGACIIKIVLFIIFLYTLSTFF